MNTFTEALIPGSQVTLTAYLHDLSPEMTTATTRPAMIVFPGGGYHILSDREAEPIALAFVAQGYNAFVLRYSIGEDKHFEQALQDAQAAVRRVRSMAGEWHIHPQQIAVCGFSAGGHLAASVSVFGEDRPNASVLVYPCILESMSPILAFPVPSANESVDDRTPPAFLVHTANDSVVPVENSLQYAAALSKAHIPFELHVYPDGPHGLALANALTANGSLNMVRDNVAEWIPQCTRWLRDLFPSFPIK